MVLPWVAIVGATATGKSAAGIAVAELLGGEVVNADASQFYRGMDIGTAKVTAAEQRSVRHHLLDVLDIRDVATVGWYQGAATDVATRLRREGTYPILVGGSGLYVRAALDILNIPDTDPDLRAKWEFAVDAMEPGAAHALLASKDPVAAENIAPANLRRIARALEVMELTGKPFSATMPQRKFASPAHMIGLRMPRQRLYERIDRRVDEMIDAGLIAEALALIDQGLAQGKTASKALGYAQVLQQLPGPIDAHAVAEETKKATRRFAKRQLTWFRAEPRIHWVDVTTSDETVHRVCELATELTLEGTLEP